MVGVSAERLELFEQHTALLFLIAGVLFAGVAIYKGFHGFTSWSVPMEIDIVVGGLALIAPALGLLGLYPRVKEAAPRLSGVGIVSAVLAAVVVLAVLVWFFVTTLQMGRFPVWDEAPVWTAAALVLVFLTLSLAFLLFGMAGLRTTVLSRRVSLLLFIPAVLWLGLLGNVALRVIPEMDFYVYVVDSVAALAIAHRLKTEAEPADRAEPAADTTI